MEAILIVGATIGLLASGWNASVVLGMMATAMVLMMSQETEMVRNISPAFFQPSTDLLDANDPLGVYSYDPNYQKPLSYTRSLAWN